MGFLENWHLGILNDFWQILKIFSGNTLHKTLKSFENPLKSLQKIDMKPQKIGQAKFCKKDPQNS